MLKQYLFHNIIHTKAPTFKRKANWISPPFDNQTFVSFFNCVVQELGPINPQYQENYSNLTMNEKTALNNLKNNQTIVIKPCDKVKGISIRYSLITIHTFSIPQYIQTTHPQTNKHTCPGRSHSHTLYAFFCLPGIPTHLSSVNYQKYCPLCLILSGWYDPTDHLSSYITHFIQPLAKTLHHTLRTQDISST